MLVRGYPLVASGQGSDAPPWMPTFSSTASAGFARPRQDRKTNGGLSNVDSDCGGGPARAGKVSVQGHGLGVVNRQRLLRYKRQHQQEFVKNGQNDMTLN